MTFYSNVLKRWSFQKKLRSAMIYLLLIAWQDVFFTRKHDIFSLDEKRNMIFLKKYMEIWYFLYIRVDVANMILRLSAKRNHGWSSPTKIHLKVIDILDWHSRKSSNNSRVRLLLQFIRLERFYNEESSILCTIQPSGVVFGGVLGRQSRKLFVH